ncbi:hypothetical protein GCM10009712_08370 [Pseudarthrobacter sulfonivorans]|uniref:hypothetical protein n=1 Tax=Pseudarthrobacter sulfonivorans TaxID=121292 RepID=UPI00168A737E|nr:hypothetical protein [Pseudarthrobacter sulfonivorans]
MTDAANGFSNLEQLVKAHRDELSKNRTTATNTTPNGASIPSTEEKLWESVQTKLLNDRISREAAQSSKERKSGLTMFLEKHAIIISLALSAVLIIVSLTSGADLVQKFKYLAATAAVLGLLAALARLWAHSGSIAVDGLGKMLGLSSALLALSATGALLMLDKWT